jgi:hypothetical protein
MKKICLYFSAGSAGGLANGLVVWLFGYWGITTDFGVSIAPVLSPEYLYPRIVWGGIWAFLFVVPFMKSKPIKKGIILSIFPTLVQLLVVFPLKAKKGYLGIDLGLLTPLFVIVFNAIWGMFAGLILRLSKS